MIHGVQKDSYNCGIIAPNTVEVQVFGDPVWTESNQVLERVKWFIRLAKSFGNQVSTCVHLSKCIY